MFLPLLRPLCFLPDRKPYLCSLLSRLWQTPANFFINA
jgi:hypothetical protein